MERKGSEFKGSVSSCAAEKLIQLQDFRPNPLSFEKKNGLKRPVVTWEDLQWSSSDLITTARRWVRRGQRRMMLMFSLKNSRGSVLISGGAGFQREGPWLWEIASFSLVGWWLFFHRSPPRLVGHMPPVWSLCETDDSKVAAPVSLFCYYVLDI